MAGRKCLKSSKYVAKLADTRAPCAFCRRNVDEEAAYGKLYSIGDIHCHYFCVLLSCCLIQKGKDEEGLLGFMYPDILAEIERSKKHRCSYCGIEGATLGCSITQCKKQFHLPCGREKKAVSLYFGNYKSFCEKHAPKQKIPDVIMSKAKSRLARIRKGNTGKSKKTGSECMEEPESVCVICYEAVDGFPTTETFWPPCCARDAWFHRSCLQRMALSAGVYYLKCPLCNDKVAFYTAVLEQGYFIPERDAAWELEQNAFSEIYERPVECRAVECKCTKGRNYDANSGTWDIKLCVLCGGPGSHQACLSTEFYVCTVCSPAAPDQTHLAAIDAVSLPSQEQTTQRMPTGPIMPSRMSLRRTKPKPLYIPPSSSQNVPVKTEIETNAVKSNTDLSREELNLKTPRRLLIRIPTKQNLEDKSLTPLKLLKQPENELLSPLKLLREGLNEKISSTEVEKIILDRKIIEEMREKFRKPKPASVKRKIVGEILEGLLDYVSSEQNVEWKKSPEKIQEFPEDATKNEDKKNVSDITMNHSGNIQNEDMSVQHDIISRTPEIISETSEQNYSTLQKQNILISINQLSEPKISEPLEENILLPSILEQLIVCENANLTPKKAILEDDSSNNSSPFQLPPEFIAESSNSLPTIDTPKKLKKINIENDSMEISENNQIVNIDLVKSENSSLKDLKIPEKKCAFKLSPVNKDIIKKNLDIDLESFKNQYLNEVDRKFNCKFDHKHENLENSPKKIRSAIDFAMDALKKPPKRKLPASDNVASKKRKTTKKVRRTRKLDDRTVDSECNKNVAGEKSDYKKVSHEKRRRKKLKDVKNKDKSDDNECKDEKRRRMKKYKNNHNTELSIRNRNINLKIRFKSEELNLKISNPIKRGRKSKNVTPKVLKQYVLQYPTNKTSPQDCIVRPDADVTTMKRKYNVKREKSSDNLKQTSIANFFKVSPKA